MQQNILTEQKVKNQYAGLLFYIIGLTLVFLSFELSIFIRGNELYLGDYQLVAAHLGVPLTVIPGILFFLTVYLGLHLTFIFCVWALTLGVQKALNLDRQKLAKTGLGIGILLLTIVIFNNQFFPNSKFCFFKYPPSILNYLNYFFKLLCGFALLIAGLSLYGFIRQLFVHKKLFWLCVLAVGILGFFISPHTFTPQLPAKVKQATTSKPNVIIIGIDSLRPDFLGYFGATHELTPNLDELLESSTVFTESLTPLARTFPTWISALTGQYPKNNAIRTDLAPHINFDIKKTLPSILKKAGYHTIFATDETRFSNIDQAFGFDELIAPPVGFNDFLLGSFSDFPLANLLIHTRLAKYLFPHSYANRAVYVSYEPDEFLNLLNDSLDYSKPIFLSIHFCLAHYPYLWGKQGPLNLYVNNYQKALTRVDQQVYDFLNILKERKILEHSIVILMSDHGEAIKLSGDKITEPDLYHPGAMPVKFDDMVNRSMGHGTEVLSLTQYHVLLAFKLQGVQTQVTHDVAGRASILDVKPTLLSLLGISNVDVVDGQSLVSYILTAKDQIDTGRHFFTESDFTPDAVRKIHLETRKIIFEGIDYFQINPKTTRLTVKPSMLELINSSKQLADYYRDWVLALYPEDKKTMSPILVNLKTGAWTDDLNTSLAKTAPVALMLQALRNFYGNEVKDIKTFS
jgi:arylsulfatase A-like enzyme